MALTQDDRNGGSNLPVAGIVALVLFASGLLVHHQPLQSDRPGSNGRQDTPYKDPQVVEARLWQDPFDAVQRQEKEQKTNSDPASCTINFDCPAAAAVPAPKSTRTAGLSHSVKPHGHWVFGQWSGPGSGVATSETVHDAATFQKLLGPQNRPQQTLILPVMVYGGPYAEDVEGRRRTRYAVLSALQAADYQPVNSRAIGYVRIRDRDGNSKVGSLDGLTVPFERWERISSSDPPASTLAQKVANVAQREQIWDSVIVLWLKEEWFSKQADASFKALFERLLPPSLALSTNQIKVIGPSGPETAQSLHEGIELANCRTADRAGGSHRCVDFISPSLTDPMAQSLIARMSPTDDALAAAIIDELHLRGIDIPSRLAPGAKCKDHLVLVVESDTHYGRSLEKEFRRQLAVCRPDARKGERYLHIYRYFRGMDGKVANSPESEKKKSDKAAPGAPEQTVPEERAQGNGQFDYLLRVAAALKDEDDEIALGEQDHIRGVVVLGTDIHDKLAVFHALREKLPQAVFATNDLDAGLFDKDQLSWTRNVVVASGYDLKIPSTLGWGVAPFRDSYQSATFLATRYALALPDSSLVDLVENIKSGRRPVQIFEIGNDFPVRLDRALSWNDKQAWWLVGLPLVTLIFLAPIHSWCARDAIKKRWGILLFVVLIVTGYIALVWWVARQPGEEPLSWQDGISVWPSEFIRLLVILLAVYGSISIYFGLRNGDQALEAEFFGPQPVQANPGSGSPPSASSSRLGALQAFIGTRWQYFFPRGPLSATDPHDTKNRDAAGIWKRYQGWTAPASEATRVGLGAGVFLVFIYRTTLLEHPLSPIRGTQSYLIDQITWWLGSIVTSILTIYILDRVAMASLFLQELYGTREQARTSRWRQSGVVYKYCGFHVKDEDDSLSAVALRSYVDLRLSAQLTTYVGRIVLYPFFLTLLLILARSRYFDNWVMPPGVFNVFVVALFLVTLAAFILRHSAERIRRYTIERLREAETFARARDAKEPRTDVGANAEQLKLMRENASSLQEGAFAPLSEQPIVRALVLPFGGAGLVSLLDWAMFMKW